MYLLSNVIFRLNSNFFYFRINVHMSFFFCFDVKNSLLKFIYAFFIQPAKPYTHTGRKGEQPWMRKKHEKVSGCKYQLLREFYSSYVHKLHKRFTAKQFHRRTPRFFLPKEIPLSTVIIFPGDRAYASLYNFTLPLQNIC